MGKKENLVLGAIIAGLVSAGSYARAEETTTENHDGAKKEAPAKPGKKEGHGAKNKCKGKDKCKGHDKCKGKDGCGAKDEKAAEAPAEKTQ